MVKLSLRTCNTDLPAGHFRACLCVRWVGPELRFLLDTSIKVTPAMSTAQVWTAGMTVLDATTGSAAAGNTMLKVEPWPC